MCKRTNHSSPVGDVFPVHGRLFAESHAVGDGLAWRDRDRSLRHLDRPRPSRLLGCEPATKVAKDRKPTTIAIPRETVPKPMGYHLGDPPQRDVSRFGAAYGVARSKTVTTSRAAAPPAGTICQKGKRT